MVTEQNVFARLRLAQLELRAPPHHIDAVVDEELEQGQPQDRKMISLDPVEQMNPDLFQLIGPNGLQRGATDSAACQTAEH